jgi:hypothetical protein
MKRLIAIALAGTLSGVSLPPPAQANPATAAGVCLIPGVGWVSCVVVGVVVVGVGTVYLVSQINAQGYDPYQRYRLPANQVQFPYGRQPTPQPGPRPAPPGGEVRTRNGDFYNIPGVQEVHFVMSRTKCQQLFNKLKQQGEKFTGWDFSRARMPGARDAGHCRLFGPSARDDRFVDRQGE